jgi:hypothetical protein
VPTPDGLASGSGSGLGLAYQRGQRPAWLVRFAFIRNHATEFEIDPHEPGYSRNIFDDHLWKHMLRSALVPDARASRRHRCYGALLDLPSTPYRLSR